MTTVRINMPGKGLLRIRMRSLIYVTKQGRYSYALVGENQTHRYYLTLSKGSIELEKHGKHSEFVRGLIPYWKCDLKHFVEVYWSSTLVKSDEAIQVMDEIRLCQDPSQVNFLTLLPAEKVKVTKAERVKRKANQVSLESICEKLKVPPSRVRAAFRRVDFQKPGARWEWGKSQAVEVTKKIKELLKLR